MLLATFKKMAAFFRVNKQCNEETNDSKKTFTDHLRQERAQAGTCRVAAPPPPLPNRNLKNTILRHDDTKRFA